MNEDLIKKCPLCAEDINSRAVKCKHCGSMLDESKSSHLEKKQIISISTFEITPNGQREMARKISSMTQEGWKEISRSTQTGKYKGGKGCCLFFLFAPLAFLAGHKKDKVIITFEKFVAKDQILKENAKNKKIIYWVFLFLITILLWYIAIPSIMIWYVWKKTNFNKKIKWLITGLIIIGVLYLSVHLANTSTKEPISELGTKEIKQNTTLTSNQQTILETRQKYEIKLNDWTSTDWEGHYNTNTETEHNSFWTKMNLTITNNNLTTSLSWLTIKVDIYHPKDDEGNLISGGRLAVDVSDIKPNETKSMTVFYPGDLSQVTKMEDVKVSIEKEISEEIKKHIKELK